MDSTEAQLRFGSALSTTTDPSHATHPMHSAYVRRLRERGSREELRILQGIESRRRPRQGQTGKTGCSN